MKYLLYIIAGIAGILIGRAMAKKRAFAQKPESEMKKVREEARDALSERT